MERAQWAEVSSFVLASRGEELTLVLQIDVLGCVSSLSFARRSWKLIWSAAGGLLTANKTLLPTPFPKFMDAEWPRVLGRITDTGAFDRYGGQGKSRGPNVVRAELYRR